MKRLVATIIAVPERLEYAELIRRHCANSLGGENVRLFLSEGPNGARSAVANVRRALEWQRAKDAEWNLFLEDDQRLHPDCYKVMPRLLSLADELGVDAFYASNRSVKYARQELHRGFVLNRLDRRVLGSHGLLYRRAELHRWSAVCEGVTGAPIDGLFFEAVLPSERIVYQVVAPILMQHVGAKSNLHDYRHNAHLCVNGVELRTLLR